MIGRARSGGVGFQQVGAEGGIGGGGGGGGGRGSGTGVERSESSWGVDEDAEVAGEGRTESRRARVGVNLQRGGGVSF